MGGFYYIFKNVFFFNKFVFLVLKSLEFCCNFEFLGILGFLLVLIIFEICFSFENFLEPGPNFN